MTNEGEEKDVLNNNNTEINKGVELLLRNRRKNPKPKTFQVEFSFFNWENENKIQANKVQRPRTSPNRDIL